MIRCSAHINLSLVLCLLVCAVHRVQRVAMTTFWRTFHHDGKISSAWWGWGVQALPLSLYLPSQAKLWFALQLRGQIHSSYFSSTPICTVLCGAAPIPYPTSCRLWSYAPLQCRLLTMPNAHAYCLKGCPPESNPLGNVDFSTCRQPALYSVHCTLYSLTSFVLFFLLINLILWL